MLYGQTIWNVPGFRRRTSQTERCEQYEVSFCGYIESKVIDSRPTDENTRIRRRRECLECGKRFTTYEIIESLPIIVVKKDKSREALTGTSC